MITKRLSVDREDYYSTQEAMEIIGVGYNAMMAATRNNIFTQTRLKGHSNTLFLLKEEVEVLRGSGHITSSYARQLVKQVQDAARDYVEEEMSSGEPIEYHDYPQVVKTLYQKDPPGFMSALGDYLGARILIEYTG